MPDLSSYIAAPRDFPDLVRFFLGFINSLTVLLSAVALLVFFRGLVSFIAKAGSPGSHAEGRALMIWGIVALFLMVSVFGILRLFYSDLGFTRPFGIPQLENYQSK